jgi:predicted DsbA family dithiol-disulfide isomerase
MAVYRLRKLWPEYESRVRIAWKALSLEVRNGKSTPKNIVDVEIALMAQQEPELPIGPWRAPEWQYPVTILPAFEALKCAMLQGERLAWEFSWRTRKAFFDESRCISMRHILRDLAGESGLDVEQIMRDWDCGSQRPTVLAESHRGWEELKVPGSPTFVLASGRQVHNPGALRVTWGPNYSIQRVDPPQQPWQEAYRELLDAAAAGG